LRQELRALRSDFDQRFDSVGQRFDGVETRLTKLEVHLDAKPDKASYSRACSPSTPALSP
jgi:hypothetical protein